MERGDLPAICGDFCGDSCGDLKSENPERRPRQGAFAGTAGTFSESLCTCDHRKNTCPSDTCFFTRDLILVDCNRSPHSPHSPQVRCVEACP